MSAQTTSSTSSDSIALFGASLGSAILGMLLTLLVLAILNGGTLRFSETHELRGLEQLQASQAEEIHDLRKRLERLEFEMFGPGR